MTEAGTTKMQTMFIFQQADCPNQQETPVASACHDAGNCGRYGPVLKRVLLAVPGISPNLPG